MKYPLISIILPVFNGELFLREAIKSCLDQTYLNLELIIVNDASTDTSLQIAESFARHDNRVQIITNSTNQKLPVSLNTGHRKAKGEFITWTSDDNVYQRDAIENLYRTVISRGVDIVYSEYLIINDEGLITGRSHLKQIEFLFFTGVIGACFLYKREVYERNRGYRENLYLVEDYDFWLRALKHSKYYKIDNPGNYFYRFHKNSLTIKMNTNGDLKNKFINNLRKLYFDFFNSIGIENQKLLVEFLIDRQLNGPNRSIIAFQKGFLKDIDKISSSLIDFSGDKLKQLILIDAYETLLKNKKHHNLAVLFNLHRTAKTELLRLPINRYLAILKKCMF